MKKLLEGIVAFREQRLPEYAERFRELSRGQTPNTLFITCADSRVVPDLLVSTDPGELFMVRNVGNLVPPATVAGSSTGDLSEASAIEYATLVLNVEDIIVCGHSECGAMKAAASQQRLPDTPNLEKWLHLSTSAVFRLDQEGPLDPARSPHDQLSQLNVLVQLEHLMTYPIVQERVRSGKLRLNGWWFDIGRGEMHAYFRDGRQFAAITRETQDKLLKPAAATPPVA